MRSKIKTPMLGLGRVMTNRSDLDYIRKFGDTCHAEVSRRGECQPCDKIAVAVTVDDEDRHWWPVCAYHTRSRKLVPLADLLRELSAAVYADDYQDAVRYQGHLAGRRG